MGCPKSRLSFPLTIILRELGLEQWGMGRGTGALFSMGLGFITRHEKWRRERERDRHRVLGGELTSILR